jgi:ribosomal protein L37AE/L43A
MSEHYCPFCGEPLNHWNQGIYECKDCGVDFPDLDDEEDF